MTLPTGLRIGGWILVLSGSATVFFLVQNPIKETLGWVGFGAMLVGVTLTIVSTLLRLWPRKKAEDEEDDEPNSGSTPSESGSR
jgi:hypothetical protein